MHKNSRLLVKQETKRNKTKWNGKGSIVHKLQSVGSNCSKLKFDFLSAAVVAAQAPFYAIYSVETYQALTALATH